MKKNKIMYFHILSDNRTVKEIPIEYYNKMLIESFCGNSKLLCRATKNYITFNKGRNVIYVSVRQLKKLLDLINKEVNVQH